MLSALQREERGVREVDLDRDAREREHAAAAGAFDLAATSLHGWDVEYFIKFYNQNKGSLLSADAYSKYRLLHR